jgi:hypothetical protein
VVAVAVEQVHLATVAQVQLVVVVVVEQFGDPHHLQVLKQVIVGAPEILLLCLHRRAIQVEQHLPVVRHHFQVAPAVAELVALVIPVCDKRHLVQQAELLLVGQELLALLPDQIPM